MNGISILLGMLLLYGIWKCAPYSKQFSANRKIFAEFKNEKVRFHQLYKKVGDIEKKKFLPFLDKMWDGRFLSGHLNPSCFGYAVLKMKYIHELAGLGLQQYDRLTNSSQITPKELGTTLVELRSTTSFLGDRIAELESFLCGEYGNDFSDRLTCEPEERYAPSLWELHILQRANEREIQLQKAQASFVLAKAEYQRGLMSALEQKVLLASAYCVYGECVPEYVNIDLPTMEELRGSLDSLIQSAPTLMIQQMNYLLALRQAITLQNAYDGGMHVMSTVFGRMLMYRSAEVPELQLQQG